MIFMLIFQKIHLKKETLGKLITDREMMFTIILSEYKEKIPEFEASFDQYNDYQNTLKNDIQQSEQCLVFYQYFHEFHVKYPGDFKRAYDCCVLKFKLKKLKNEPSISIFKSYVELFHNKSLDKRW